MKKIILSINGTEASKEKKQNENLQKKLAKVDKLKAALEKLKKQLQKYERVYKEQLGDQVQTIIKTRERYVEGLFKRLQQKSFSHTHKHQLIELLQKELVFLSNAGYSSDTIVTITQELEAILAGNIDEQSEEMLNFFMQEMAEQMGVDIEDDTNIYNFKEHFEQAFRDKQESEHQESEQRLKEKKAAHTDKDFYKLYKSLAKKAHPDLATEAGEKEQREEWMKELSEVWSDRNYVKLLQLSQKISGDPETPFTVGASQYKNIIKQLNQEINELEVEKYMMTTHDHVSSFYYQNFKSTSDKTLQKKIDAYKAKTKEDLYDLQKSINELRTQKTTRVFLNEMFSEPDYFDDSMWY